MQIDFQKKKKKKSFRIVLTPYFGGKGYLHAKFHKNRTSRLVVSSYTIRQTLFILLLHISGKHKLRISLAIFIGKTKL